MDIKSKYKFEERIGAGTFGLVYRVTDIEDSKLFQRQSQAWRKNFNGFTYFFKFLYSDAKVSFDFRSDICSESCCEESS